MIDEVLSERLAEYAPANALEQEHALQEIMQHYVLASLSKAGLFTQALFHGGTCLRIVHRTQRFSEDLDFLLKAPDPSFRWDPYLDQVHRDCAAQNLHFEVVDRSTVATAVRKAFLKTESIGQILAFDLPFGRHSARKIRIKVEIDTNPPAGSTYDTAYIMFPRAAPLTVQSLSSGFGTKLHALLCRTYTKGRDWHDFAWYVSRNVTPDLAVLANALTQQGPWAGAETEVTLPWLAEHLGSRIRAIDWPAARDDVQRFLPLQEQPALAHWSAEFFLYHLGKLVQGA